MNMEVDSGSIASVRDELPEQARAKAMSCPALAVVAISAALGILCVAEADIRSRASSPDAYGLFWAGLGLIFIPVAWRLCRAATERNERLVLVGVFGISLYLVKCLYSPTAFVFTDEFAHVRTILNLIDSGRLFGFNPEIRVAADYPGTALVTLGLSKVSALSIVSSGMVVVGAARLLLMVSLFLLLEKLTGSARTAGVGCLIYAGNANFLYWDAQFAYESLALPLALAALYLLLRRSDGLRKYLAPALIVAAMVVITHHIVSYALVVVLAAWTVVAFMKRRGKMPGSYVPAIPAVSIAIGVGLWLTLVAPLTFGYLLPVFDRTLNQGVNLVLHQHSSRVLFANPGGAVQPQWEKVAAFAAVLLAVIFVLAGLVAFHRRWSHPLASVLAWSSPFYLLLLPLRFTSAGQETANRSSEYLFIGIGLVVAMMLTGGGRDAHINSFGAKNRRILDRLGSWRRFSGATAVAAFGVCSVMFIGGVAVSWSYAERLPPPLRASGVPAPPTPDVIASARWILSEFGPYHRVATDITTGLAFDTFGEQNVQSGASNGSHVWRIFEPSRMTGSVYRELVTSRVNFVVVQRQLTEGLSPVSGAPVYDAGEPSAIDRKPASRASQAKFIGAPALSMVYTSGTITIYQVDLKLARALEKPA